MNAMNNKIPVLNKLNAMNNKITVSNKLVVMLYKVRLYSNKNNYPSYRILKFYF